MTMRVLIFILTTLTIVSCKKQGETSDNSVLQRDNSKNTLMNCFPSIDTTKVGQSIGCSGGIYKLINDRYIVHLLLDYSGRLDTCYTISIDSLNGKQLVELFVFEDKDASLANICTDVIITNQSEASRKLYAQSGELIIAFSDPTEYHGNETYHVTVLITKLVFTDSTGDRIELENELLWKVLDLGTSG